MSRALEHEIQWITHLDQTTSHQSDRPSWRWSLTQSMASELLPGLNLT